MHFLQTQNEFIHQLQLQQYNTTIFYSSLLKRSLWNYKL